jgi:hypothetical protein
MTKIRLKATFQAPKTPPIYTENVVTLAATNVSAPEIREGAPPVTMKPVTPQFQRPIPLR